PLRRAGLRRILCRGRWDRHDLTLAAAAFREQDSADSARKQNGCGNLEDATIAEVAGDPSAGERPREESENAGGIRITGDPATHSFRSFAAHHRMQRRLNTRGSDAEQRAHE